MESLIILPIIIAVYWVYMINNKPKYKSGITKIDDKHFIINNEYVSLDYNDDLHKMRQDMEDRRVFMEFVKWKQSEDLKRISDEWLKVKMFKNLDEEIKKLTLSEINNNRDKYAQHVRMCKVLSDSYMLTEQEFSVKEKTIGLYYLAFGIYMQKSVYTLHSPDNAKYSNNMTERLKQEFKEKYY